MSIIGAGNTLTTGLSYSSDTTGNLVFQTNNSTALTLTSSQTASFAGSVSMPNTFGFKNRIINGGMSIDQRNAGASVTITATAYTLDRWQAYCGGVSSKFSVQQNAGSVTPPTGFINYLGTTSLSAYSVSSTDRFGINQTIEGLNVADLGWGTANAKTVTLSFWVRSSLTGTFGGSVQNYAANRSYPFSYTISSANTWTSISITIAGDTTGTWLTTNSGFATLNFGLGVGSTYSGTAGTWAAADYRSVTGATSVVGTSGATFYITGVQLETGSQATTFDFRDYGRELIMCQRYYYQDNNIPTAIYVVFNSGNVRSSPWYFPVTMRVAPTVTFNDANGNVGKIIIANDGGSGQPNITPPNSVSISQNNWRFEAGGMGGTAGNSGFIQLNYFANAEL